MTLPSFGFVAALVPLCAFVSCGSPSPPPKAFAVASPSTTTGASPAPCATPASSAAVASTHVVVQLMLFANPVGAGSLMVSRVLDDLQRIAEDCRVKHAVVAGAHANLALERKGALVSTVVGVTVVDDSQMSPAAIACLRDAILEAKPSAEVGTFNGARLRFE